MSLNDCHVLHCAIRFIAVEATVKLTSVLDVSTHVSTLHYGFTGQGMIPLLSLTCAIALKLTLPQNNPCKVDRRLMRLVLERLA